MNLIFNPAARSAPLAASLVCAFLICMAGLTGPAHAVLEIDITRGRIQPMPIAVSDFGGQNDEGRKFGRDIVGVIENNLRHSGLFKPIDHAAFIEKIRNFSKTPRFGDWRIINAQALLTGRITVLSGGRLSAKFKLWDVFAQKQMTGLQFSTSSRNWRRIGHMISDAVYQRLTGEKGYFDTRIIFIEESGPKDQRIKRLAIMDQDGQNVRRLTDGRYLVLTPRFSPTAQEITYMSYEGDRPRVYLFNIETGRQRIVGDFPGMTFAPRFSPDGKRVIMSLQSGGNASIYTMNLRTRKTRRLTTARAIDTAPSYSPDGRFVVFESDRAGKQQLYVMSADGRDPRRISYGQGAYSTPVWSPRGDLIAFTKQLKGRFLIGVMRSDGSGERILTAGYHNEGPTWSPNGRVLMYFREVPGEKGGPKLWSVDLTGYNQRQIKTSGFASDPAWSPLIK